MEVLVKCLFFPCLLISPWGPPSCNCDVLYIPLQCLTQNPKAERNSKKIPLSCCHKADKCYCCKIQGTDLYCKFFLRECHYDTNSTTKREEFSFPYSLYLHGVDWNIRTKWQHYIWCPVNMLLNYLCYNTLNIISLWTRIALYARYAGMTDECFA